MNSGASSPLDRRLKGLHLELTSMETIAGQAGRKILHLEEEIARLEAGSRNGVPPATLVPPKGQQA